MVEDNTPGRLSVTFLLWQKEHEVAWSNAFQGGKRWVINSVGGEDILPGWTKPFIFILLKTCKMYIGAKFLTFPSVRVQSRSHQTHPFTLPQLLRNITTLIPECLSSILCLRWPCNRPVPCPQHGYHYSRFWLSWSDCPNIHFLLTDSAYHIVFKLHSCFDTSYFWFCNQIQYKHVQGRNIKYSIKWLSFIKKMLLTIFELLRESGNRPQL